jgi:cellulose synthase/poly-beta-1,6-N-acetylglucosamine synthase-like glycosyltransferase
MELVIRMRKYMYENKIPFLIKYIPESLCWTEVPANKTILIRQRMRWARGLIQTLFLHRNLVFNPKYERTAFFIMPYFIAFEFFIPIMEVLGIITTLLFFIFFEVNYLFFFYISLLVYIFYLILTIVSIFLDDVIYKNYANAKEIAVLILMAIIEPFFYHPVTTYACLKGYYHFIKQKEQNWGNMQRQGFSTKPK